EAVAGVVGVEGDVEEPLLAAARHFRRDVEERVREQRAVLDDADPAGLLDDEDPRRVEPGRRDVDRRLETRRDAHAREGGPGDARDAGAHLEPARGRAAVTGPAVPVIAFLAGVEHAVPARHVLAEAGCRAAVTVACVAVVALLAALDDAVAAARRG